MPELTTDPPPGLGLTGSDSEETDQELEQYRQMIMQFRNEIRRFRSTENCKLKIQTQKFSRSTRLVVLTLKSIFYICQKSTYVRCSTLQIFPP